MSKEKKRAWHWCSRFCRLRDALDYCKRNEIDLHQFARPEDVIGECCTCGIVKSWIRMDAGHYKSRGMGGGSGVYFDERNVNLQCKQCNAWKQGAPTEYREFIIKKYGKKVLADIEFKHRIPISFKALAMIATKEYYKGEYKKLLKVILDLTKFKD